MDKKFFELKLDETKAVIGGASAPLVATTATYMARPAAPTSSMQVASNSPDIAAFLAKYKR